MGRPCQPGRAPRAVRRCCWARGAARAGSTSRRAAAGGTRAVLANVSTDLRPVPTLNPTIANAKISLICTPAEARGRLRQLEQLGLDDALLVCPFDAPEQLEAIRALM